MTLDAQALGPGRRMTEAVVADRTQAPRQDVPEVTRHELHAREGAGFPAISLRTVLPAEADALFIHLHHAAVGADEDGLVARLLAALFGHADRQLLPADLAFADQVGVGTCRRLAGIVGRDDQPAAFERRGERLGHGVWDLKFQRNA